MNPKQIRALIKRWPHSLVLLAAEVPCHERTIYKWLNGSRKPHKGMVERLKHVIEAAVK